MSWLNEARQRIMVALAYRKDMVEIAKQVEAERDEDDAACIVELAGRAQA